MYFGDMKQFATLILLLLPLLLTAQKTQTIRGKVTDKDSRLPLEGARVWLPDL